MTDKIVEFTSETSRRRLFGLTKSGGFYDKDNKIETTWSMPKHVRKYCMFKAPQLLKFLKNPSHRVNDPLSCEDVTLKVLEEVVREESWFKFK
jgi:hypothetical protein